MLVERAMDDVADAIRRGDGLALWVVAPNYEERSLAALCWLVTALRTGPSEVAGPRVAVALLRLRGQESGNVLTELTELRLRDATKILEGTGWQIYPITLEMPRPDRDTVRTELDSVVSQVGGPCDLYLDVSCVPRSLVLTILRWIQPETQPARPGIGHVTILYSWAAAYPDLRHPEDYGAAEGAIRAVELPRILRLASSAHMTVIFVTAGNGYDAGLVYEQVQGGHITRHWLVWLYRDDPLQSWRDVARNQDILSRSRTHDHITYCFTPTDINRHIRLIMKDVMARHNEGEEQAVLMALFGPKPLTVAAYDALVWCLKQQHPGGREPVVDIIRMSGFQYTSVYSLGFRSTSAYEWRLSD